LKIQQRSEEGAGENEMKRIIGIVIGVCAMFVSFSASAEERTTFKLAPGEQICFSAVSGATADSNPSAHPACNGLDKTTLARIDGMTAKLNQLRGRTEEVAKAAARAQATADAAVRAVGELDTKVTQQGQRIGDVERRVTEVEGSQGALLNRMDAVEGNEGLQNTRLASIESHVGQLDKRVAKIEEGGNKLRLRASYLVLHGVGGDTIAAPAGFVGLSIPVGSSTRLGIELGGSTDGVNLGTAFKPALAFNINDDGASVNVGLPMYAFGLTETSDSKSIFGGLEIGASVPVGPVAIELNAVPAAINFGTEHDPVYGVGINGGVSYTF
jgi:hypothetical protein